MGQLPHFINGEAEAKREVYTAKPALKLSSGTISTMFLCFPTTSLSFPRSAKALQFNAIHASFMLCV